jgi:hypothetical protein
MRKWEVGGGWRDAGASKVNATKAGYGGTKRQV